VRQGGLGFRRDISVASESYAADILAVTSIGLTSSFTIFFVYLPPLFDRLSLVVSSFIDIERLDGFLKWTAWKSYPRGKSERDGNVSDGYQERRNGD
jgi:hypothetical protein